MATDGEHSDCQWLDLREHLQETMMFSSRFMFVFPVKFSMKKSGMQWCFTFSGKRNILFFSFAGLLAGLTWSIQNRSEWRTTTNQLFYSEQSPKGQTFRLHSASFLKNIVDVVGSPQTLSTHINPTKGKKGQDFLQYQGFSKKRKKQLSWNNVKNHPTSQSPAVLGPIYGSWIFWNFPHRPKYRHSYCQRDTNCILDQSSSPFTKLSVAQHRFFWLTNAAGVDGRVPHAKNACYRTHTWC